MGVVTRAQARLKRSQESGGGPADLISYLPDAILGSIITLLPTKDGARTQILSTLWRLLCRSAPLNLSNLGDGATVSRILFAHKGPARHFDVHAGQDDWLQSPALQGLQEFFFSYSLFVNVKPQMPPYALSFWSTLRIAHLGNCNFPPATADQLRFPNLQHLTLPIGDHL